MKEYSIEKLALVTHIKKLEAENKKLREALESIEDNDEIERADAFKFIALARKTLAEIDRGKSD